MPDGSYQTRIDTMRPKPLISIAFLFILTTCWSHTNQFPNKIKSGISENHFRIKGSKLYVIKPKSFTYNEDVNVFKHDSDAFIYCLYLPASFPDDFKDKRFNPFYFNKNYKIISKDNFSINDAPGIFYKLEEANSYWYYFIFGDSLGENRIVARCGIGSPYQDTIFNFVEHAYYQPGLHFNVLESAKYSIDLSGVGFQFVTLSQNQYTYIENNYKDYISKNERANLISIMQIPKTSDTAKFEQLANVMSKALEAQGMLMKKIVSQNYITINSQKALKIITLASYENKDLYLYQVITENSQIFLQFAAILYHDGNTIMPSIDKSISSLKLKE